jgi:Bacterial pre-peptidase C-terminal domain
MNRPLIGLLLGCILVLGGQSARADGIKHALFGLGYQMSQAEGVAIEFIGEAPKLKPGAIAIIKRAVKNSIDIADVLKLPTTGLKSLQADIDTASFANMATSLGKLRLEMQANAAKSINPGAGAFYIMGIHLEGAERIAVGAQGFARDDKPGTGALIERQLTRLADGAGGTKLTLKPVLDIQDKLGKGASFADLASDLTKLRLKWQDELAAQPSFGVAAAVGGKVIFSTADKLATTDPKDKVRTAMFAKIHVVTLKAGQTVVIDLESGDGSPIPRPGFFDTYLRLEDSTGKELAHNDDISGADYNSRLAFMAPADGNYRLIVTSYGSGATGAYTLKVTQK